MHKMTKRLFAVCGTAMVWAACMDRESVETDTSALSYYYEDGPGSGSDAGVGSNDPIDPVDPVDPVDVCTGEGGPTQAQLDQAKAALQKYLKGCTGQAAVDKVMGEFDKNPKDGKLNRKELLALIKKLGLGGFIPYAQNEWCKGVMNAIDANEDGQLTPTELLDFLDKIGLGSGGGGSGSGTCSTGEDMPTYPGYY
jgi:hypothetical protein